MGKSYGTASLEGKDVSGGKTRFANPDPLYTTVKHFTLQTIWAVLERSREGEALRWVEVGYVQGWPGDLALTTLYWAEQRAGEEYEEYKVTAVAVGPPGTPHVYQAERSANKSWTLHVDGTQVGESPQDGLAESLDIGGEMFDENTLTPTVHTEIRYRAGVDEWRYWNQGGAKVEIDNEGKLKFSFEDETLRKGTCSMTTSEVPDAREPAAEAGRPRDPGERPGGGRVTLAAVEAAARGAALRFGDEEAAVTACVLTSHGALRELGGWGESYGVAPEHEVFHVVLRGRFRLERGPRGARPIVAEQLTVEVDAATGEVLAVSTARAAARLAEPGA